MSLADFVSSGCLILAQLKSADHISIAGIVKTPKRKRSLETHGGHDVQKTCYDHRRARDFVARIVRIRASRRSDERSVDVQQCDPYREP
jgi:hypothetical protein